MMKIAILCALSILVTSDVPALEFKDSDGTCTISKVGTGLQIDDCNEISIGSQGINAKLGDLQTQIDQMSNGNLVSKLDTTASNTRCDECFSRDISVSDGSGWGSVYVEIEAWGGHQGGGTHGCYYHSKLSLNAYQDINHVKPDEYKSWGGCGEFLITRPDQADNMDENLVGCDPTYGGSSTTCEAGVRSVHGWHGNVIRVKKTAGTAVYQGPYFIKITLGGGQATIFHIKDSTTKACPALSALESTQSNSRLEQPDTEINAAGIATLKDSVLQAGALNTKLIDMSGSCSTCLSRDFYIGQGNTWADIEAWGGHQGGGIHGAYIHGKYTVNGYSTFDPVTPVVTKEWGSCGHWEISRPAHGDTVNPCVVLPAQQACSTTNTGACIDGWMKCQNEDGTLSMHGWHPNVMRVKYVPSMSYTYGGPFHVKFTTNRQWDDTRKVVDTSSIAC